MCVYVCMCVCGLLKIAGGHRSISDQIMCVTLQLVLLLVHHCVQVLQISNLAAVCLRVLISYDKDCNNSC